MARVPGFAACAINGTAAARALVAFRSNVEIGSSTGQFDLSRQSRAIRNFLTSLRPSRRRGNRRRNLVKALISIREFSEEFGVSRSTVYRLHKRGEIEFVHIGRAVRIPKVAVENWIEGLKAKSSNTN
ncbi:helix-turn-helix transcriptional regulator [Qipengyuania aquimaris]|uniref:helix-turn-helix transcriptional regulator n=1 Tax=Qipengyuania aquimaris TaxID=255984 RepID=UPI0039657A15